ncbi:hypothetical protein MMC32_005433 [Xylographa parallela]|nr:hypothetical protein [Xylographa parallela]
MDTILENREIQSLFSRLSPALPCELVTKILDLAEKWHLTLSLSLPQTSGLPSSAHNRRRTPDGGDYVLLASPPLTRQNVSQLRKITFGMTCLNHGWDVTASRTSTVSYGWTSFGAVVLPMEDQRPPAEAVSQAVGQYSYHDLAAPRFCMSFETHSGFEMESPTVEVRRAAGLDLCGEMKEGRRVAFMASMGNSGWVHQVKESGMEFWSAEIGE